MERYPGDRGMGWRELGYGQAVDPTGQAGSAPTAGAPAQPVPIQWGVYYLAPVGEMAPPPVGMQLPVLGAVGAAAVDPAAAAAPVPVYGIGGGEEELEEKKQEEEDLWASVLREVSAGPRPKLPTGKNILILGETASGKTTLMAKMQGADHTKKGSGLKYLYLNIHDEDIDDHTCCNVWILDGDLFYRDLLKFVVTAESLEDTLPIFVADMSRPWTIMESLQKWTSVLQEHIDKLKIPSEDIRVMKLNFAKDFQSYLGSGQRPRGFQLREQGNESVFLPLGDRVLTHSFGIPVLVVCTKCDAMRVLEKVHGYSEEHFDFIQSHIRRFCLKYGAALIYTSAKEGKNLDLLFKYMVHKIYGFPFTTPALVMEKDAVFIPAGWDNEHKIAVLHESFTSVYPEDEYEDFIIPPVRKLTHFKEVVAEDDQEFLLRQQAILARQPATPTRGSESSARGADSSKTQSQAGAAVSDSSPAAAEANTKTGSSNEGVLATFFNSLLNRKPGCPMGPAAAGMQSTAPKQGQRAVLRNVQEELGRMTRKSDSAAGTKYSKGKKP
ncbi:cytoplasmic dynein 1 light intermediate chain 2 [Ornithorhynchus anatinus]|uniref:Dynein light intermediate chain n=1 Tax=Ornithorhynchus anatinus TaxID=9258 RepID=A0A6I8N205_ORNAN|nr:cytoplasmic dynein 1 light intermediate chain 2 [Ornithorhynchus anatinus]